MPKIIETRICKQTGKSFDVLQEEVDLLEYISPILGGKKYMIPVSSFHPDVNHQWHLAWRNERTLYRTTCALTGKSVITNINPDQGFTVYHFLDYRSDKRNKMDYGIDIDEDAGFTEQFGSLFRAMPQQSLCLTNTMENCHYCNHGYYAKDCYMTTSPAWSEQCYYSSLPIKCQFDIDGYGNTQGQYLYQCMHTTTCHSCQYVYYSRDCQFSAYLLDCQSCENCFLCVNLTHKKYNILNQQYSKEDFFKQKEILLTTSSQDELYQQFLASTLSYPRRATRGSANEDSIGDLLYETKNNYYSFYGIGCSNNYYCWGGGLETGIVCRSDLCGGGQSSIYESMASISCNKSAWCISSNHMQNCYYCFYCINCEYCFGCIGLQYKQYCIFNKQYTQEAYETHLAKLIDRMQELGEWGNFFHPSISYFPYNDTDAYERIPETKETILSRGRKWIDKKDKQYTGVVYHPESIESYRDNVPKQETLLAGTLVCEVTGRPYRIIRQELDFYLTFSLQIPRKHPDQRYAERKDDWRLPRTLFERECAKTGMSILTPYAPNRKEIVWCEDARDKEFLG